MSTRTSLRKKFNNPTTTPNDSKAGDFSRLDSPFQRARDERGFTLIEIIVVVALIALITSVSIGGISTYFKVSLDTATGELASIVKEAYNSAVVTGKVHRVAYDIDKKEYWVEVGPANMLLDSEESRKADEKRRKLTDDKESKKESPFTLEKRILRKKKSLPNGVSFDEIKTEQSKEWKTSGIAYTHIFPHGITEKTVIHIKDNGEHKITLILTAILGKTKQMDGYIPDDSVAQ